jgi:predicted small lipoprotein YifL
MAILRNFTISSPSPFVGGRGEGFKTNSGLTWGRLPHPNPLPEGEGNFRVFWVVLLSALVLPLSACGVKGKLKTPAQIEQLEAKKAREEKKMKEDKAKENSEETPEEMEEK